MKNAFLAVALLVAACDDGPLGPQPDQKIVPKEIQGPPPSHRPIVDPAKAIPDAPKLAEPPAEPKPAEPAPAPAPEKEPARAPAKKPTKAKSKKG